MGIDENTTEKIKNLKEKMSNPNVVFGDLTSVVKEIVEILTMMDEVKTVRRKYYGKDK
jgi:hypothetical protein